MSPNYVKMDGPRREGMGGLEDKYGLWLYREGGLQGHLEVRSARKLQMTYQRGLKKPGSTMIV